MKDVKDITVCVSDCGLFIPAAQKLAETCKRVLYQHPPAIQGFPSINQSIVGDGFGNVECVEEFWPELNEIDLFVFPDIGQGKLQLYLESIGKAVWGSRDADLIESNREKFLRVLEQVGLKVPRHETVVGLSALRKHLKSKKDKYVKISKYRRDMETYHWRDYETDSAWLDLMSVKLGYAKEHVHFLVFDPIDAAVEVGADTYCVDGKFPNLMLHADESKDRAYIGAVTLKEDMPDLIQEVMEKMSPVLAQERYRNQMSMETRGDYYIDATHRGGMPSTSTQLETWGNFADIVWHGASGELVEPEPVHLFSVEACLKMKGDKKTWGRVVIPDAIKHHVKLTYCCEIDGAVCFPVDDRMTGEEVGWLTAGADTLMDAISDIHSLADALPDGLSADTDALTGLLAQIHDGEKEGVEFSQQELPEPEDALKV